MPGYSPTVRRRRLAAELRKLREHSGQTGDQIAEALGWSASKISRYELARTGLKPMDVRRLLDFYGVSASRRGELLALASEATGKGWWAAYSNALPDEYADLIGLEDEARSSLIWQVECVPGLLQTEEYARQINSGFQLVSTEPPGNMERRVEVRMRRQQVLVRDRPLELSAVLDESALLRQVADQSVMRAQLERLLEVAEMSNVSIRILPLRGKRPVMAASFVLLTFGEAHDATFHDVVFTENLTNMHHFFDGELDTYLYRLTFDRIFESALSATDSKALIAETAITMWG